MSVEEEEARETLDYVLVLISRIEQGLEAMNEDSLARAVNCASELMEISAEALYDSIVNLFNYKYETH